MLSGAFIPDAFDTAAGVVVADSENGEIQCVKPPMTKSAKDPRPRSRGKATRRLIRSLGVAVLLTWPARPHAQPPPEAATSNGFSPLDEITAANVKQLVAAFTFRTGKPGAHTSAPLAVGNVLLVLTPFPHTLFGLDLAKPNASVKWTHAPRPNHLAEGLTCCGAPTGGIAAQDGRVYLNSLDGQEVHLPRKTAKCSGMPPWHIRKPVRP